jgi:WD repeat-containing protein 61
MAIRSLQFTPDSQHIVSVSDDKKINIYDVAHLNCIATLLGHQSWVLSMSMSPGGKQFATGFLLLM